MRSVQWSEKTPFPGICEYHLYGCSCGSPVGLTSLELSENREPEKCDYCEHDIGKICKCCNCECECEEKFIINADSFNQWVKETCYVCDPSCFDNPESETCIKHLGAYRFYLRNLPTHVIAPDGFFMGVPIGKKKRRRTRLSVFNEDGLKRYVSFDGPVLIPVLAKGDEIWMSLTPNEIYTMRDVLDEVSGRVLIAGLGMGWLTNRVCELPNVTEAVQIEIDSDIIEFFGRPLLQKHSKLTMIQDDAYRFAETTDEHWDAVLFDIWPGIGDSSNDKRFKQIRNKFNRQGTYVWGWGDIW